MTPDKKTGYKDILETFSSGFPLLQKVYEVYEKSPTISKDDENTLRRAIEMTTLEALECIVVASRQAKDNKRETLEQATRKLDTLKVFVDLSQKIGQISKPNAKKLTDSINVIAKMVKGWIKNIK